MSEPQEPPTTSTRGRRRTRRSNIRSAKSVKQRRLRLLREDEEKFDEILPLVIGLESDSDSDSSDDDFGGHAAVLTYLSTLNSALMRLHAMLASGDLNYREFAEEHLKCMVSINHVQCMQLLHFMSGDDGPKFDLFETVMNAKRALERDIEMTEQRRYMATRKPPILKTASLMVGVKDGTIDTGDADSLDQLIVFLRYVATGRKHDDIAEEFGCSVGAVTKYVTRVVTALQRITAEQVKWPDSEQRNEICKGSGSLLRGCIGYIDGVELPVHFMSGPRHAMHAVLLNSKGFYSVSAQIVCTHDNRIIYALIGFPGSSYDSYNYQSTMLWNKSNDCFSPGEYLIGDKAYPLSRHLITPYKCPKGGTLSQDQLTYNRYVSSQRIPIERTVGMLRQRFQILQHGFRIHVSKNIEKREERFEAIHRVAFLLCGLHNMLKDFGDDWNVEHSRILFEEDEDEHESTQDEAEDELEDEADELEDETEDELEDEEPLLNPEQSHIGQLPDFQRREEGERLRTQLCREVYNHRDSISFFSIKIGSLLYCLFALEAVETSLKAAWP
ncbi:hypothetical protein TRICI_001753 [Trichomonascus ciferrii]|uniref:DDE Tnp4 domain-containing protein n=1 Tax=Trichomonascus ciferrii TaxID=44093 RepID=A0A642V7N7_9ASCO|nr:hypothetical protein TRICI_001753 [Trichomonascus ciferrii]